MVLGAQYFASKSGGKLDPSKLQLRKSFEVQTTGVPEVARPWPQPSVQDFSRFPVTIKANKDYGRIINANILQNDSLYYVTSTDVVFPIPISDTNGATFPASDKGILFMRWIRKHLASTGAERVAERVSNYDGPGHLG